MTEPRNDAPLSSRSGTSNPFGKCTEDVRARVPYAVKEGLARLVNESGMSEQEYVREVLMVHVLGVDVVLKIHEQRLMRAAGQGQEKAD